MTQFKEKSRRQFIKTGVAFAGSGILGYTSRGAENPGANDSISHIPLNNILADYKQINNKFGFGIQNEQVATISHWKSKRQSILTRSEIMMGNAPESQQEEIEVNIEEENHRGSYNELKIGFPSGTGDGIKGYLLIPDGADPTLPRPGVIAMHSTGPGATQTVGLTPKPNRGYGKELAERGYVVLAIDVITAGERVYEGYKPYYSNEFYRKFPEWSVMGKNVHDHQKAVDYLSGLDIVDPDKIGSIGHSLGGYNAIFLQVFDPRIRAAVSSCGLSPMGGTQSPYQFARNDWYVHFNPCCREYIRAGMIPCDMHEFMSLSAPRHLFNYSARQDSIYCHLQHEPSDNYDSWWKTVEEALDQITSVYEVMGASDHFVRVEQDGDHDFPPKVREQAYEWLDEVLGR